MIKEEGIIKLEKLFEEFKKFLLEKNKRYGNSAIEPIDIFFKHIKTEDDPGVVSILVRLDDKLKRIKTADKLRKNDVVDIAGYLLLLMKAKGWEDFSDLID